MSSTPCPNAVEELRRLVDLELVGGGKGNGASSRFSEAEEKADAADCFDLTVSIEARRDDLRDVACEFRRDPVWLRG